MRDRTVRGCFRCISLRTEALLVAFTFLICSIGYLVMNIVLGTTKGGDESETCVYVATIWGTTVIPSNFLLVYGLIKVVKFTPRLLRNCLVVCTTFTVINAVASPLGIVLITGCTTAMSRFMLMLCLLCIVFQTYSVIVAYVYYRSLVEQLLQQITAIFSDAALPTPPAVVTAGSGTTRDPFSGPDTAVHPHGWGTPYQNPGGLYFVHSSSFSRS